MQIKLVLGGKIPDPIKRAQKSSLFALIVIADQSILIFRFGLFLIQCECTLALRKWNIIYSRVIKHLLFLTWCIELLLGESSGVNVFIREIYFSFLRFSSLFDVSWEKFSTLTFSLSFSSYSSLSLSLSLIFTLFLEIFTLFPENIFTFLHCHIRKQPISS